MASPAPIIQLSDDILYEIFRFYVASWHQSMNDGPERFHPQRNGWIRALAHVCRRWRTIAIGSPVLWSQIVLNTPEVTAAFLEKVGGALFSVAGVIKDGGNDEFIRGMLGAVLQHADRIVAFDVLLPNRAPVFLQTLGHPSFPRLTALSLERASAESGQEPMTVPSLFDPRDITTLESLRVRNYPMTFITGRNLQLQRITTFDYSSPEGDEIPARDILDLLRAMPLLEDLSLSGSFTGCSGFEFLFQVPFPPVPLPRLRRFSLTSRNNFFAVDLLRHLILPDDVTVRAHLKSPPSPYDDYTSVRDICEANLSPHAQVFVETILNPIGEHIPRIVAAAIHLSDVETDTFRFRVWTAPTSATSLFAGSDALLYEQNLPGLEPKLDIRLSDVADAAVVRTFCPAFALQHVQAVFISHNAEYYKDPYAPTVRDWISLFDHMPIVRTLSVTATAVPQLQEILSPTWYLHPHIGVVIPQLQHLFFKEDKTANPFSDVHKPTFEEVCERLGEAADALRRRAEAGVTLTYLGLPDVYGGTEMEARLVEDMNGAAHRIGFGLPDSDML